ncbi:MAG: hypothetical protein MUF05_06580 [Candidatus Omnitrophica bacterium]|jgi:hypothetical protein|nr:hypothetical protein [Candidatus Omnitrophota bacterium]
MFYCRKKMFPVALMIFILTAGANSASASWWELGSAKQELSVPYGTEEVKREERMIAGRKLDFIYYASSQGAAAIKDFYRKKLSASGWTEQELMQNLKKLPAVRVTPEMEDSMGRTMYFSKDPEQVIISFMPSEFSRDNKTRFTVSYSKTNDNASSSKEAENVFPKLLAHPKKDVTPVYPGASLLTLSEQDKTMRATYSVSSDIEPVANFYKDNMSAKGWNLVDMKPIERKVAGGVSGDCPSCKKLTPAADMKIELALTELNFSNPSGDKCNIMLSNASNASENMSITTILVDYAENKK